MQQLSIPPVQHNTSGHSIGPMYPPSAFMQPMTFGQANTPIPVMYPNVAMGAGANPQLTSGMSAAYPGTIQYPSGMSKQQQMRMPSTTSGIRMVIPPNIGTQQVIFGQRNRMDPMILYSPNVAVSAGTNPQLTSGIGGAYPGMIQYDSSGMSKQQQMV